MQERTDKRWERDMDDSTPLMPDSGRSQSVTLTDDHDARGWIADCRYRVLGQAYLNLNTAGISS